MNFVNFLLMSCTTTIAFMQMQMVVAEDMSTKHHALRKAVAALVEWTLLP